MPVWPVRPMIRIQLLPPYPLLPRHFSLSLQPMASFTLLPGPKCPFIKSSFLTPFHVRPNLNPRFPPKYPASASASWEREEALWLREEQRWLREEQRWLREESRWRSERESLLSEIASLRHRIEVLERRRSPDVAEVSHPLLAEETEVKEMVLEGDRVRVSEERRSLRIGSEGKEVRAMQEALLRLGFYSGEEDMEFSCFSSGTERAVKTWQASVGTPDDGIMTSELLEMLFMGGTNGAPIASLTEITEIQQTVIKESGDEEVEESDRKVFLLGENRWEEPSRLSSRNKPASGSKVVSATKCLTCRGEGRLLCTECDGTGEPNIEPQFLEWIGEGAKCTYCEGQGYTICEVCEGKKTLA